MKTVSGTAPIKNKKKTLEFNDALACNWKSFHSGYIIRESRIRVLNHDKQFMFMNSILPSASLFRCI